MTSKVVTAFLLMMMWSGLLLGIVFTEIADGRFSIKTDKPNVKVSWQVTGIRQGAWGRPRCAQRR